MDKMTRGDVSPQTERELTSPLSPKRPRTDSTVTDDHSGENRFDFPELWTFQKIIGFPSSVNLLQKNADLVRTAEREDIEDEKPLKQPQDTEFIVNPPITKLTPSHIDDAHAGSPEACFIAAERPFPLLVKDEQPPLGKTDKLSSYPADDAGGELADSHTSKDTSADTSSHPDCERLGKSLEGKIPGGCTLPAGNKEDGRQLQNSVSQSQASPLSTNDEAVRPWSDCALQDTLRDAGFCKTWSQSAEVEESNQRRNEHRFNENILLSKKKEEGSSDDADSKPFYPNHAENPSGNLAEGVKNTETILELQICESERVAARNGETKGQVNENGVRKNSAPSAVECAEGSIVSSDVVLARNNAIENVSLEADDFCGAKDQHAAGRMMAKASETANHTTETPNPVRISQELAVGDNDEGPFSVIDPAIWSETHREGDEKHCNSVTAAGVESPPSVKVHKVEIHLPLSPDVRPSQEVSAPAHIGHRKEDLCQSHTEPQIRSIATNETHRKTGDESSHHWIADPSSSPHRPTKPPPAGDHDAAGHQSTEQDRPRCFPVMSDRPKTQQVEDLLTDVTGMDGETEMKEREEIARFEEEIKNDEHGKSEHSMQPNEKHKEDTTEVSAGEDLRRAETFMVENKDDLLALTFPPSSDAVVPGPRELIHSQNADSNPSALDFLRFSPAPSAFAFCDHVPGAFDTFEKIQLSPDDDGDDDAGSSTSPLLTSLPGQLLKTPWRQLYHSKPEAESSEPVEEGEGERGVERYACHSENMANEFLSSGYSCNDLPNFIPAADATALGWPEQRPDSESACSSSECFLDDLNPPKSMPFKSSSPASVVNGSPEFEMKRQFDTVLRELSLYFDISARDSASNSRASSPERCSDRTEVLEGDGSNCRERLSSPELGRHRDTSPDDADEERSPDVCGSVSRTSGSGDGEQEVPLGRRRCQEASTYTAEQHREPRETEQKKKTWSPSFMCLPFLEQLSHRPPEQHRRLEPLRTCTGPIRVGLSKRAKTKHLHRPHPYK